MPKRSIGCWKGQIIHMQIERTKNASRNIVFGVMLKIYQIVVPFFMRTAMIYLLGAQYLGLNSLFSSVLQVLNLAELGVGSAMVYSMYKPIAEDDSKTICALMGLYKKYYTVIGAVILVAGGALTPFIPNLIKMDTVPEDINVHILYLLNLAATVLSYWVLAYKQSLLSAHQRNDVISKISMCSSSLTYIVQFLILYFYKNFYAYTIVVLMVGIVNNVITAIIVDHMYPQYGPKGKLDKSEIKKINQSVKDLFTSKLGTVVYDSADTIVISAFLGMEILAIFQNYFYILTSVMGIISIVFTACTAGIGNSIIVETKEKNFNDLKKFTFIISWFSGWCSACLLCLYQPFMDLWVGKKLMLDMPAVVCFSIYFFVRQINSLLNLYKDAAGMWHEDRYRPLVCAIVNLVLNLILVQFIGIYGVLISTVLTITCVGEPWLLKNLFTVIFRKAQFSGYLKQLASCCVSVFAGCTLTYLICNPINFRFELWTLLVRGFVCCIIPNVFFIILFKNKSEYAEMLDLVDRMTKHKFKWLLKCLR